VPSGDEWVIVVAESDDSVNTVLPSVGRTGTAEAENGNHIPREACFATRGFAD
jgi:hypothetical protein